SEFIRTSGLATVALLVVIAPFHFLAGPMIAIPYGQKWASAAPLLAVLVWQGLFRGLARVMSPLLLAVKRPDLDAKAKIIEAAFFIPLTIILVQRWSAVGAAWAGVICYSIAYVLRLGAMCMVWREHRIRLLSRMTAPIGRALAIFVVCEL